MTTTTTTEEEAPHPNLAVLQKFDPANLAAAADVVSNDFVWHFINPKLPDVQGDYVGLQGLGKFFETMAQRTNGTFHVEPVSAQAVGDELVVTQTRNTMVFEQQTKVKTDVVLVWRIVNGRITEVWDIPSVFTAKTTPVTE